MNWNAVSEGNNTVMIYKNYGTTGLKVSAIGFGGMRLPSECPIEEAAAIVKAGFDAGINYFDTAPGYGRSEDVFGCAFKTMPRDRFILSTKTNADSAEKARRDVENSLRRMGVDSIDILHMWCVMDMANYRHRVEHGVLDELIKMRDEGLVRHLAVSTHMNGEEMGGLFREYPFEGVLLGCSAINFPYRERGIAEAAERNMGVVVMNPLGGGLIPGHPEYFEYLKTSPEETVTEAALRFLIDDPAITVALVGLANEKQIAEAVRAVEGYRPLPPDYKDRLRSHTPEDGSLDKLCTSCGYCQPCPMKVPIVKLMDAYNHYILNDRTPNNITDRLNWHWGIRKGDPAVASCIECGCCESKCTQKLPIVSRLRTVAQSVRESE